MSSFITVKRNITTNPANGINDNEKGVIPETNKYPSQDNKNKYIDIKTFVNFFIYCYFLPNYIFSLIKFKIFFARLFKSNFSEISKAFLDILFLKVGFS